jgi:hypothetical protein
MNNKIYDNRIVKLISPINNEILKVDLSGDENELKDLIGSIINVTPSSIKGLKDNFGNYYTISSAIKSPFLKFNSNSLFLIVLNNNYHNLNYSPLNNDKFKKKSFFDTINNNYNDNIKKDLNIPNNKSSDNIMKNKTFVNNKYNNIKKQNSTNLINDINIQIASQLLKEKYIDQKMYNQLKQFILEENPEILTLFKLYNLHGKNLNKLSKQIKPVLDGILESSRKKQNDENLNLLYNQILDSLENEIKSKNDIALLRRLLICDNQQIIKVMENYKNDNDKNILLDNLKIILKKFRGRFSVPNNNQITSNDPKLNKIIKIEKKILKCFSNEETFKIDCIYLFKYDMSRLNNQQKLDLFNHVFKIKNSEMITQNSKSCIKEYYQNYVLTILFPDFTTKQTNIYNDLVNSDDENMINFFRELIENNDIKNFTENVLNYIHKIILERNEIDESEEDNKESEESEILTSSYTDN